MAKSKKADSKKDEPVDDIPEEMVADIQDAVSGEDAPSSSSKQIPITHWEEDPVGDEDGLDVAIAATKSDEEEPSVEEDVTEVSTSDGGEADAEDGDDDDDHDDTSEDDDSSAPDDHEWHLIDDKEQEAPEGDDEIAHASELEEVDEEERPEWDEEKWKQSASLDEDASDERPEWDDEKWRQANIDEEEVERPEWDEEKWKSPQEASTETEEVTEESAYEIEAAASTISQEDETEAEPSITQAAEADNTDEEVEEDADKLSAAQLALNQDDESAPKKTLKSRASAMLASLKTSKGRTAIAGGFAILLLLVISIPTPRYAVLNTVGVRASASVIVTDSETNLPLRDVTVELASLVEQTDADGRVVFDDVRLGTQQLTVTKSAYDSYTKPVRLGVGENAIPEVELVAVGTSFEFELVDWLSGDPVAGAEVVYEANAAYADDEGIAKLNTPSVSSSEITVVATAPGYVEQKVKIDTTSTDVNQVGLVLDRYHSFVSQRDGTYDVYKILADGSNEELLVKGTGNERSDIRFGTSPDGKKAVLVATRDTNIKNADGFVLSGLYLIDVETGTLEKVDSSERIDLVGWIGDRIVYVKVQAGASGRNPQRHRLVSYDTQSKTLNQIAASNYFNDVLVADEYVFYAPSDAYKQNPKPYLYRSNADGTQIETVFEKNVWTVIRSGINEIRFDSDQTWYSGEIQRIFNVESEAAPTEFVSRLYSTNPSGSTAAWVDRRDGQGVLLLTDTETEQDEVLISRGGLRNPIVWISDSHLIFRVVSDSETADYVINIKDGEAKKIRNVTDVSGADRWYFYY